jgi:hypothetical protein
MIAFSWWPWHSGFSTTRHHAARAGFGCSALTLLGLGRRCHSKQMLPQWPFSRHRSLWFLCAFAPDLVTAVPKWRRASRIEASALDHNAWIADISGALTVQVILQFLQLVELLDGVALHPGMADSFIWRWSPSGQYSAASAYNALFLGQCSLLGAKELWKTKAPNKCRFFVWLALQGRCWTAARRLKHDLQNNGTCVLCCQVTETCGHLLAACSFSRQVWFFILSRFGFQQLTLAPEGGFRPWWLRCRKLIPRQLRKAFDSLIILVAWQLWLEHNDRTFSSSSRSAAALACG